MLAGAILVALAPEYTRVRTADEVEDQIEPGIYGLVVLVSLSLVDRVVRVVDEDTSQVVVNAFERRRTVSGYAGN